MNKGTRHRVGGLNNSAGAVDAAFATAPAVSVKNGSGFSVGVRKNESVLEFDNNVKKAVTVEAFDCKFLVPLSFVLMLVLAAFMPEGCCLTADNDGLSSAAAKKVAKALEERQGPSVVRHGFDMPQYPLPTVRIHSLPSPTVTKQPLQ